MTRLAQHISILLLSGLLLTGCSGDNHGGAMAAPAGGGSTPAAWSKQIL